MEPCFLMSSSIWPLLHNLYIGKLNYCPTMWGRKNKRCYSERLSEHIENLGNMMWIFYELNRNKLGIQRIKTHLPQPLLLPLKPKRKRLSAQLGDPIETAHQVGWVDEWQGLWIENIVSCIPLSLWTSVSSILAILMHLYQPSCHQVPTLHGTFNWYHIVEELDLRFGPLLLNRSYQWVKRCQSHKFIQ